MGNSLYDRLASFKLARRALWVVAECRCRLFDWQHHIETCHTAELSGLTIRSANAEHGVWYHPSHPRLVFRLLAGLNIDYRDYVFIDLGSGKGRTLVIASQYPFQKIVGVEFAEELHKVAVKNVRDYRCRAQRCTNIECLPLDATEFRIPPTPTVFYLYNSFRPPVLIPVLRNIEKSLSESPRDVLLIYVSPFHGELIERETRMRQVDQGIYHKLYRFSPAGQVRGSSGTTSSSR